MEDMESERGGETAQQQPGMTPGKEPRQRRADRRDGDGLFAYQGPERRSGGDRRESA